MDFSKFLQEEEPLKNLLDFFITPISKEQDRVPRMLPAEEEPNLFNMATDFITEIKEQPKWRVPENKDFQHYAPDMGNVDFGGVLPSRSDVETLILEAAGIAGVRAEFTEGHRTPEQSKLVGGSKKSKHLYSPAQAFDLAISGNKDQNLVYERELRKRFGPLGFSVKLFSGKNHVHLQWPPPEK